MVNDAVAPAYGEPRLETPRPHDRFLEGFWSGRLEVVLDFPKTHPLVIGAGWLELDRKEKKKLVLPSQLQRRHRRARKVPPRYEVVGHEDVLTSEIVRHRGGKPVIPGSSLKGAVRQVHEILTASCGLTSSRCQVGSKTGLAAAEVCPTCSLFGANGLMGRLRFHEGVGGQGVDLGRRSVPVAWPAQRPEEGKLRVYDQRRDEDRDGNLRKEEEWTYAAWGPFHCPLTLVNASDEELGLLFAALGVGWTGPGPGLRVGGKKFHGFGGATVRLTRSEQRPVSLAQPPIVRLDEEATRWAVALRERVLEQAPATRKAFDALHRKMARTEGGRHAHS